MERRNIVHLLLALTALACSVAGDGWGAAPEPSAEGEPAAEPSLPPRPTYRLSLPQIPVLLPSLTQPHKPVVHAYPPPSPAVSLPKFVPLRTYAHKPPAPAHTYSHVTAPPPKTHHYGPNLMEMVKEVQVTCDTDARSMQVEIHFTKAFEGKLYTKGYFFDRQCAAYGTGAYTSSLNFPLDGCGTTQAGDQGLDGGHAGGYGTAHASQSGVRYENTVMVMFERELGVIEAWDRSLKVSCEYEQPKERTLTYGVTLPMLDSTVIPAFRIPVPAVSMKVVQGKDITQLGTKQLVIGQYGTIVITLEDSTYYDLFVSNCYAHDGVKQSNIQLIDKHGCPTVKKLIGQHPQKAREQPGLGQTAWWVHFQAFKFPDRPNVYFVCNVKICQGQCYQPQCGHGRHRRQAPEEAGQNTTELNVFRGVSIITPDSESITVKRDGSIKIEPVGGSELGAEGSKLCVSTDGLLAGLALTSVALCALLALCVALCYRQRRWAHQERQEMKASTSMYDLSRGM